jgi:hypothetical protein
MLIAKGVMTERGYTRRARIGFCSKCKAKVIRGLDADVCAFETDLDLEEDPASDEVYILRTIGRLEFDVWSRDRPVPPYRILLTRHRCKEKS